MIIIAALQTGAIGDRDWLDVVAEALIKDNKLLLKKHLAPRWTGGKSHKNSYRKADKLKNKENSFFFFTGK